MKDCWSRGWAESPIGAELKRYPQDFVVSETLSFELSGTGEHLFVQIEKTSLATPDVARLLARVHGIELNDVGYAGMKDKHAVTTQWFSLRGVMDLDHPFATPTIANLAAFFYPALTILVLALVFRRDLVK